MCRAAATARCISSARCCGLLAASCGGTAHCAWAYGVRVWVRAHARVRLCAFVSVLCMARDTLTYTNGEVCGCFRGYERPSCQSSGSTSLLRGTCTHMQTHTHTFTHTRTRMHAPEPPPPPRWARWPVCLGPAAPAGESTRMQTAPGTWGRSHCAAAAPCGSSPARRGVEGIGRSACPALLLLHVVVALQRGGGGACPQCMLCCLSMRW